MKPEFEHAKTRILAMFTGSHPDGRGWDGFRPDGQYDGGDFDELATAIVLEVAAALGVTAVMLPVTEGTLGTTVAYNGAPPVDPIAENASLRYELERITKLHGLAEKAMLSARDAMQQLQHLVDGSAEDQVPLEEAVDAAQVFVREVGDLHADLDDPAARKSWESLLSALAKFPALPLATWRHVYGMRNRGATASTVAQALAFLSENGASPGPGHQRWTIDEVTKILAGDHYEEFIKQAWKPKEQRP